MAGAGFTQMMINSIRNNNRRKQHASFNKNDIKYIKEKVVVKPQFKKATKLQLLEIKNRLQSYNKSYNTKLIVYTVLSSIGVSILAYTFYSLII